MTAPRRVTAALLPLLFACAAPDPAPPDAGPTDQTPPADAVLLARRPYAVVVPPGYSASKRWPLLLVLGGYGDTSASASAWMGYTALAATEGFVLATPDGVKDIGGLPRWNVGVFRAPEFDSAYLVAVIHDLEAQYAIDHGRVYAAGHSLGAHMAHRLACDAPDEVAGIASLAGQVSTYPPACAPARGVSALQIHGTYDVVIGYYGDLNEPPSPDVPSAHQSISVWGRNDQCTGAIAGTGQTLDLDDLLAGSETTVEAYDGCPAGLGAELWTIVKGSHRPHLGANFASATWGFLQAHARTP
jgi:polyhydroxybutyrate depolymerase